MVRYSVTVCNHNMVETLERSLRSILDQVGDEFEVVVVDGGSDDGSVDRFESLSDEYPTLRVLALDPDEDRALGADRQRAVEAARGEYVLPQLDADDVYEPVLEDFVDLYTQLESQLEFDFFLSGDGLNMAPRSLLLDVPYRNLRTSEDRDLWRRLFARDSIVWLEHGPVAREIGYEKTLADEVRRDLSNKVADARTGITLASCLRWTLRRSEHDVLERRRGPVGHLLKSLYDLVTYPLAHSYARPMPGYETPGAFERRGELDGAIANERMTLEEIEATYDVTIDRARFSDDGRTLLCLDS